MKTYTPKANEIDRKWFIVDAKDKTLGHLATRVADKLRGKDKPIFTPHLDCGDFVIIVNADKVKLTGTKEDKKLYHSHSGFPGGYRSKTAAVMRQEKPTEIVKLAIRGMLPKNRLKDVFMDKLKIYAGEEHPHEAQKPQELNV